jgi:hypothetical protein
MNDRAEVPATGETGPDASENGSGRKRLRRTLLAAIALLYIASVPWYRETGAPLQLQFGLPDWVAVAVGCYIAVAILNAFAWMLTDIPDGAEPDEETRPPAGPGVDRGAP